MLVVGKRRRGADEPTKIDVTVWYRSKTDPLTGTCQYGRINEESASTLMDTRALGSCFGPLPEARGDRPLLEVICVQAYDGTELAGLLFAQIRAVSEEECSCEIRGPFVLPDSRGMGLAGVLLEVARERSFEFVQEANLEVTTRAGIHAQTVSQIGSVKLTTTIARGHCFHNLTVLGTFAKNGAVITSEGGMKTWDADGLTTFQAGATELRWERFASDLNVQMKPLMLAQPYYSGLRELRLKEDFVKPNDRVYSFEEDKPNEAVAMQLQRQRRHWHLDSPDRPGGAKIYPDLKVGLHAWVLPARACRELDEYLATCDGKARMPLSDNKETLGGYSTYTLVNNNNFQGQASAHPSHPPSPCFGIKLICCCRMTTAGAEDSNQVSYYQA